MTKLVSSFQEGSKKLCQLVVQEREYGLKLGPSSSWLCLAYFNTYATLSSTLLTFPLPLTLK